MRYIFGDYVLDTQRHELYHAGEPVLLRRRAFQVLAYLLTHRDRVVSKQELLEQLWPDQFIGDAALASCLKALRRALGERGRTPRYLRTLHGQGYRFVATVEEREHLPADPEPPAFLLHEGEGTMSQAEVPSLAFPPLHADSESPLVEALVGEYKQVTALCGALAEAPTLAARLGPEAMYCLMREVLALAQEMVQHYDGTLLYISSEGFLALFGAPVAQEDHARRAVLAALDLRQRTHTLEALRGQPFGVALRLGLHSWPVVVGSLADAPPRPYAAGATLHGATQLQLQAAPDTLLVSAATYALVQDEVHGEVCEPSPYDALSTSVPVYAIHGVKQRRSGVPNRGARLLSRFVGRAQELALLHTRLSQAVGEQGQVIGIAGEPGLGKSRLLAEFSHRLDEQAVTYCEGHCLTYGSATPYLPVCDLLRKLWGLSDSISAPSITATVQQRLSEAGMASEAETLLLLQLLDVPVDLEPVAGLSPQERKTRTFALLRHLFWHASQQQPLVLALENLHWVDPTSEKWLTSLVERLEGMSVLLLATYRSGYQPPWLRHSAVTQMALPRLSPHDSLAMLQSVPQAVQLPVPLQQAIVARAAGSPFFVEELTWAAVAHGDHAGTLPIPDTIEAVLAARLDQLPPEEKHLVQTAAVIGTEVPVPLLQRIAGLPEEALQQGLGHLQSLEFLYETHLFPEHAYTFKHALTREVAYNSLLHERRRVLHAQVIGSMETLYAERLHEYVERLAHHALRGELWDKALLYYRQAGAKAEARFAYREAMACFEQALSALQHLPENRSTMEQGIDLRFDLRNALLELGDHTPILTYLRQAEALAQALGDQRRLGWVLAYMTRHVGDIEGFDCAIVFGDRALAIAEDIGDISLQIVTQGLLGQAYHFVGDYRRALEVLTRNVAFLTGELRYERFGLPYHASVHARTWLAMSLAELGSFTEGSTCVAEAVKIAEALNQPANFVHTSLNMGFLHLRQGDFLSAITALERGIELCQVLNLRIWLRNLTTCLGYAYALSGCIAEAVRLLEKAVDAIIYQSTWNALCEVYLSEVYLLAGRRAEAIQLAERTLAHTAEQHLQGKQAWALRLLADIHAQGDPPKVASAEVSYRQALTLAEELGMRPLQAHCHRGLGTLYTKSSQWEQARAALAAAITLYRTMDMIFWLPQVEAMLAVVNCNDSCS